MERDIADYAELETILVEDSDPADHHLAGCLQARSIVLTLV
jgi:hypothetical protein